METKFGVHSEVGKLRTAMVCRPGLAHQRLTPSNCDTLLFDDVLWVDNAKRDHFDFVQKMRDRGVDVGRSFDAGQTGIDFVLLVVARVFQDPLAGSCGQLTIEVSNVEVDQIPQVMLAVRDTGIGMEEQFLKNLFEKFSQEDTSITRQYGGTGLGLAIARDIAQAHGGTLTLQNLPAGGLEARLVLPRRR